MSVEPIGVVITGLGADSRDSTRRFADTNSQFRGRRRRESAQDGGVYVSVELLGVVIAAFAVLVTLGIGTFAGFAWIVRRIDRVDVVAR